MMMKKNPILPTLLLLTLNACVESFTIIGNNGRHSVVKNPQSSTTKQTSLTATMDSDSSSSSSRKDFLRKFVGVITTVGLVESRTQSVSALEYEGASSSLNLAAEIKTLDFSLPSYGDLSDAKASVENVEGLAVEPLKENTPPDVVTKSKNKTKQPKEAKKKSSGGGGPDLSGILPSVGKQSAEDRKKAQTERAAIKAAAAAAAKEEREQKAAAASVDNIKTVDMSLPSYSDSTFAKDKSVFSL